MNEKKLNNEHRHYFLMSFLLIMQIFPSKNIFFDPVKSLRLLLLSCKLNSGLKYKLFCLFFFIEANAMVKSIVVLFSKLFTFLYLCSTAYSFPVICIYGRLYFWHSLQILLTENCVVFDHYFKPIFSRSTIRNETQFWRWPNIY